MKMPDEEYYELLKEAWEDYQTKKRGTSLISTQLIYMTRKPHLDAYVFPFLWKWNKPQFLRHLSILMALELEYLE